MPILKKSIFPPVESADENGIVAVSEVICREMLADAYLHGIFPWPFGENSLIPWMFPPRRGVIMTDEFHIPSSLRRELKRFPFILKIDHDFEAVITACAEVSRPGQEGTWITSQLIEAYCEFHRCGFAHSFEAYLPDGTLAGGLYGVSIGRIFCGESMFFRFSGASKFAMVKMAEILSEMGVKVIDTQMVTNITASFGAREISGSEYLTLLKKYGGMPLDFSAPRNRTFSPADGNDLLF